MPTPHAVHRADYATHRPDPWWSRCGLAAIQGVSSAIARLLATGLWDGLCPA